MARSCRSGYPAGARNPRQGGRPPTPLSHEFTPRAGSISAGFSINTGDGALALPRRANQFAFRFARVQPRLQKYSAFAVGQIKSRTRAVSSHRGALRNVINAERDAVDAEALLDERR
jgi:hypothetical protein